MAIEGLGTFDFRLIGVGVDPLADGSGKAGFTLEAASIVAQCTGGKGPWESSRLRSSLYATAAGIDEEASRHAKRVRLMYARNGSANSPCEDEFFLVDAMESGSSAFAPRYAWYKGLDVPGSGGGASADLVKELNGEPGY